jgi:hypothetical protein
VALILPHDAWRKPWEYEVLSPESYCLPSHDGEELKVGVSSSVIGILSSATTDSPSHVNVERP